MRHSPEKHDGNVKLSKFVGIEKIQLLRRLGDWENAFITKKIMLDPPFAD